MDKALETQLANIQKRTGKSLDELAKIVRTCGLTRHGEIRDFLKAKHGMGHGDANAVVHIALKSAAGLSGDAESEAQAADRIYAGPKAGLRTIHDALMKAIGGFGDFEVAPKKTYLSLRRKKQFATIGPGANSRVDVGLNARGLKGTARLEQLPPGGMCQYRVKVLSAAEVNKELLGWIRQAFDASA